MTGPIAFTPTPAVVNTDASNANETFAAVAATTKGNFELINSYLRPNVAVVRRSLQGGQPVFTLNVGNWTLWPSANWAPFTFALPTRVSCLLVGCSGRVEWVANPAGTYGTISVAVTGSGIIDAPDPTLVMVRSALAGIAAGRMIALGVDNLRPGLSVTVQPVYLMNGTLGQSQATLHVVGGVAWAIALV